MNTERLKRFRTQNGFSQKKLAGRLGISQSGYDLIENGLKEPSLSVLIRLSEISGYTLDELAFEDGAEKITLEERFFNCRARLFAQITEKLGSEGGREKAEALKAGLDILEKLTRVGSPEASEKYRLALKLTER